MTRPTDEPAVFITVSDVTCVACHEALGRKAWITLHDKEPLCLACAEMEHLVFLPAGDAALTRRSKKYAGRSAVVLRWSSARKRYERQGILVTEEALAKAEAECLGDQQARQAKQARAAERRAELDVVYVQQFAAAVRARYPRMPAGREAAIAEHACQKYSGRVGRTANAKSLAAEAIDLAVRAHVRHAETEYDALLTRDLARDEARAAVQAKVAAVLAQWGEGTPLPSP